MKIAFIYSYAEGETWSTPLSLATEFQSRGWDVSIYSLLSAAGNYTDAGLKLMLEDIKNNGYTPDIIFYLDWGQFDSLLLDKRHYPKAYWVMEAGDEPQNYYRNSPKAKGFDLILSPDWPSVEKYNLGGNNAIWWTHFSDSRIHFPRLVSIKYDAVSTRGPGSSDVLDNLQAVLGSRFKNRSGHEGALHAEALQEGRMVIQHSRWGEITRRIFEAMACGKLVLTDRLGPDRRLESLFIDRYHIVYYDSFKDCVEKINYYLEHDKEREEIALRGKTEVISNHTQYNRVNELLKHFRRWKKSQK